MDPIGQWLSESARPTSGPALSVGCERAVRVGLERRCWAGHAGPSCQRVRAVSGKKEKEKGSWAVGAGLGRSVKELACEGKKRTGRRGREKGLRAGLVWVLGCYGFGFEFCFRFSFYFSFSISNPNCHATR